MVGHERAHDRARLSAPQAGGRVVDGLVHAEPSEAAGRRQPLQVAAGLARLDHQRECRRVRRDDQVLRQSPLQAKARHAESAILIVERCVDRVVPAFGDSPRHAALVAVLDLTFHRRVRRLIEEGVGEGRHHQQRHQVLEHRAAPGQEDRLARGVSEQASQREPALLRQSALCDADEAAQACFRRKQIVVACVAPMLGHVVADREQMPRFVVQEFVFLSGQLIHLQGKHLDRGHPVGGAGRPLPQQGCERRERLALGGRQVRGGRLLDDRQHRIGKRCDLAQRRDGGEIRGPREAFR